MADNDDYWEKSETKGFNFDDDEAGGSQMCGVSLGGTARLFQQIQDMKQDDKPLSSFPETNKRTEADLHKLIPMKTLNCILEADNFDLPLPKSSVSLEEEVRILRRKVENFWIPLDVDQTVQKMFLGQPYMLELYRSYEDKKKLLEAAVALGDGDTILAVVLYLSKTLKKSLLNQLLMSSPVAANHYAAHLSRRMQTSDLMDLLEMLGRSKDASMKQFEVACQNQQRQLQRLRNCAKNHYFDSKTSKIIENFIQFLEWQDETGIKGDSVIDCLSQACHKHWSEAKGIPTSPLTLTNQQNISDKQFQWTAVTARAELKAWGDVENLFIAKSWLGGRKVKSSLSMEHIITQLHKFGAPSSILNGYMQFIDNVDRRLNIARTLHCHKTIIDVYVSQRDRQSLVSYKSSLHPQSEEYFYAENALRSPAIKWRN
uniref:Vps16 C-terminal domain-containing protein n=3 Tax=Clastoptera arizonana TaxID=38151 RepID=A0A1B6DLI8_9HEMI